MHYRTTIILILIILALLSLVACETTPTNPEYWMEKEINACVPTAIIFKQSLKKYNIWSEVFRYEWKDNGKLRGHAMVAYMYPPGKNQLWTYDNMGSWRTFGFTNNVLQIAAYASRVRGNTNVVLKAEWIK